MRVSANPFRLDEQREYIARMIWPTRLRRHNSLQPGGTIEELIRRKVSLQYIAMIGVTAPAVDDDHYRVGIPG